MSIRIYCTTFELDHQCPILSYPDIRDQTPPGRLESLVSRPSSRCQSALLLVGTPLPVSSWLERLASLQPWLWGASEMHRHLCYSATSSLTALTTNLSLANHIRKSPVPTQRLKVSTAYEFNTHSFNNDQCVYCVQCSSAKANATLAR